MRIGLIILLFVFNFNLFSQKESYFQQKLYYDIDARINTNNNILSADFSLIYKNNSPDTLDFLLIHLYPNAYSSDTTAFSEQLLRLGETEFYYSDKEEKGYIDSLNFSQDGNFIDFEFYQGNVDIIKLILDNPLKPGDSTKIESPFKVKFPSHRFSRLGVFDDGAKKSYQITQWYPKPAVYDKDGWHPMPYLHLGEYYSEFAEYVVKISIPENFQIASSGKLVNSSAIGNDYVKYNYQEKRIHDFAIFTGNLYKATHEIVELPESGRKVRVNIMYRNKSWSDAIEYAKRGLLFYSEMLGDYPYDEVNVVQAPIIAGAGMEYPKITAININGGGTTLDKVIIHEIGHNWFYGILAFNERDFPWLDEGLNSYLQYLYEKKYYSDLSLAEDFTGGLKLFGAHKIAATEFYKMAHLFASSRRIDQQLNLKSDEFSNSNYGLSPYVKAVVGFNYLNAYLPKGEFHKLLKEFYQKYKFTHPHQDDFIDFIKDNSSKNTDWFFDNYLKDRGVIDFSIARIKNNDDSLKIIIVNKNKSPYPFRISTLNSEGEILEDKWILNDERIIEIGLSSYNVSKVIIDKDNDIPDINIDNNQKKIKGLFKKRKLPHLHFIADVSDYNKKNIFLNPAIAYNSANGFMAGVGFYNDLLIERKWQYYAFPLYSFKTNNINGVFNIERKLKPVSKLIRKLSFGLNYKNFAYDIIQYDADYIISYKKYKPYLKYYFNYPGAEPYKSSSLELSVNFIEKEYVQGAIMPVNENLYIVSSNKFIFGKIDYNYKNDRQINPYSFNINSLSNMALFQFDMEAEFRLNYKKADRFLDIRIYAAKQFYTDKFRDVGSVTPYDSRLRMSAWNGDDDFLYENTFVNRSGNLGSSIFDNQVYIKGAGFIIPTILGNNDNFIAALNLKSTLPMTKYVKVFANFGTYPYKKYGKDDAVLYEAGLMLSLIDKHLEVYFPILWSQEIKDVQQLNGIETYRNNIRFVLNLNKLNLFEQLRKIQL